MGRSLTSGSGEDGGGNAGDCSRTVQMCASRDSEVTSRVPHSSLAGCERDVDTSSPARPLDHFWTTPPSFWKPCNPCSAMPMTTFHTSISKVALSILQSVTSYVVACQSFRSIGSTIWASKEKRRTERPTDLEQLVYRQPVVRCLAEGVCGYKYQRAES